MMIIIIVNIYITQISYELLKATQGVSYKSRKRRDIHEMPAADLQEFACSV